MSDDLTEGGLIEFLLWLLRRRRRFRVTGNSMLPLLKPGEEVLVDPNAYRRTRPQTGDIVMARHPNHPDLHLVKRVVSTTPNNSYILQGDNPAESTDSRVFGAITADQILGRVTSRF